MENTNDLTYEDVLSLTDPVQYDWTKHNLTIVRDGYFDCGTRIHVVAEQKFQIPIMIDNAMVISEDLELFGK